MDQVGQTVKQWGQDLGVFCKTYTKNSIQFYKENPKALRKELLSGATVAILQVPESVAFSFVAGVDPIVGLYATVFMGAITGLFGGKPAMISGAAGALAVVAKTITDDTGPLSDLTKDQRVEHLFLTMVFVGIFQMVAGIMQLAKFVALIPETAMIGFMNGLAIIIFLAQLTAFQACDAAELFQDCTTDERTWLTLREGETWAVMALVFITMLVMHFSPRIPRVGKILPASLVALFVTTFLEHVINRPLIGYDVRTIEDTAPIDGGLPSFAIPSPDDTDWGVVLSYAVILGAIGLIESVMTLQAVNEITNTAPTVAHSIQECVAQGLGNLVSALFGSMGGDAMIGQSTINVMNGARGRLSAVSAGFFMFIIIVAAHKVIDLVPIASLTGVLFMVVIHTFNLDTFKLIYRLSPYDGFAIILVTTLAVVTNLAYAVLAGIIWTSLVQSWNSGKILSYKVTETEGKKLYTLSGPLFFGSVKTFVGMFNPIDDPDHVTVDFANTNVADFSGVAAIRQVSERYHEQNKHLVLKNLCDTSMFQLNRTKTYLAKQLEMRGRDSSIEMEPLVSEKSLTPIHHLDVFHPHEDPKIGDPDFDPVTALIQDPELEIDEVDNEFSQDDEKKE